MNPTPVFARPLPARPQAAWAAVRPRVTIGATVGPPLIADMSHPTPRWGA